MFGKISTLLRRILMAVNIAVIAMMLLTGFASHISPESFPVLCNAGHVFPLFAVLNGVFLVVWIIVSARRAVVPVLGFIVCYSPMRTYCPLNIAKETPDDAIKVISYNVMNFNTMAYPNDEQGIHPAMRYVLDQDADIVCLQESPVSQYVRGIASDIYPYIDTVRVVTKGNSMAVLSKYPIIKHESIEYESKKNLSAVFFVKIGSDTLTVINNHLETSGLSLSDRHEFKTIVHSMRGGKDADSIPDNDTIRMSLRRMMLTLAESATKRAPQARAVAQYIKDANSTNIIVCGDFNDSPLSYSRRVISQGLTDCYVSTANGPGWTYTENGMRVRIDNIFCSPEWQPYNCKVDKSIKASDHYPIVCWLRKRTE